LKWIPIKHRATDDVAQVLISMVAKIAGKSRVAGKPQELTLDNINGGQVAGGDYGGPQRLETFANRP
jgi:hypothetical protein